MKTLAKLLLLCAFASSATAHVAAETAPVAPAPEKPKNCTPPAQKIYAQTLADQIMAKHPEWLSVTFHGVPPGLDKVYTMFAGSHHDRIGNPDDPDDIDVTTKGIMIVDPRWHRTNDTVKKSVMMPLRTASGENVGLLVVAYKHPDGNTNGKKDFFLAATARQRSEADPEL
jgi:hypothetical protein